MHALRRREPSANIKRSARAVRAWHPRRGHSLLRGARVGGRRVSRLLAGVSGPVVSAPQARQQRDRVAACLDIGHTGALAGAHLPVVRGSTHDPQELASTQKFAPRSNPAGTTRRWHLRRRCLRVGSSLSCVPSPPQNPHKSGSAARFPTESPRTKRHSPAHGGTDANMALPPLTGLYAGSAGLTMLKLLVARAATDLLLTGRL